MSKGVTFADFVQSRSHHRLTAGYRRTLDLYEAREREGKPHPRMHRASVGYFRWLWRLYQQQAGEGARG